jgi:hypothetical protein
VETPGHLFIDLWCECSVDRASESLPLAPAAQAAPGGDGHQLHHWLAITGDYDFLTVKRLLHQP